MDRSRTKQVCTIGPASISRMNEMVAAGMDVARINFSHGTPEDHRTYVHAVRSAAHSARRSVAVLVDLPGPKIRLGKLEGDVLELETGAAFVLHPEQPAPPIASEDDTAGHADIVRAPAEPDLAATDAPRSPDVSNPAAQPEQSTVESESSDDAVAADPTAPAHDATVALDPEAAGTPVEPAETTAQPVQTPTTAVEPPAALGNAAGATVSVSGLAAQLQPGDRILLADGAVELRVTGISGSTVETEVVHGGTVRSRSGVNIPSDRLTGDGLTQEDRAAIPRALELRADLIAQSFVRTADDVKALRSLLPPDGPRVIAKIETRAAVENFDDISQLADGIMVARGDLGVDIPFEDVPLVQKDLVRRATKAGRFSIVATQMLESMTTAARPTRAEASDVANAVLDGADAVMLSAESAIGAYPVETLQAMARICTKAEAEGRDLVVGVDIPVGESPADQALAGASYLAARARPGTALWCFTRSGRTAEALSLQRPGVPIVAFTLSPIVARRLAVRSGVIPMVLPTSGARGEPLIGRMQAAWRAQKNRVDYQQVILVTTSRQLGGINRIEVHLV